ncbi:hypothetical protein [Oryza sativa Japonica Group]|uniref:Uncharacterized protein n=1 Tax=Oryza sativa subsp. japonica TaxID=39947 RepID=Q5JKS7_ORYSJ|nr:hypothetical protein [Oryza sativa Japonica Group]
MGWGTVPPSSLFGRSRPGSAPSTCSFFIATASVLDAQRSIAVDGTNGGEEERLIRLQIKFTCGPLNFFQYYQEFGVFSVPIENDQKGPRTNVP